MALSAVASKPQTRRKTVEKEIGSELTQHRFAVSLTKAKEQLTRIVTTYLEKNEDGYFVIPFNRQRPVMLIGAAGIGKTDAPKQVAEELGICFVSYSMTHHTRQSALGLPKIIEKNYGNNNTIATEYTMSEIIAAVYDEIKATGCENGILFLDEINCVPESLSAVLLQLFQNKTLGQSSLPEGWVLVMAGNPPEYNKSVKQFDAVTTDRLRIIHVVPDADAWLEYAEKNNLHSAVVSFISSDKNNIYCFDGTGSQIVTPRGWEELSINLSAFEKHGFAVEPHMIAEFIGFETVAMEFYDYYRLITEVICEDDIDNIINGENLSEIAKKVSGCTNNIKYMLITCLKRKLHTIAVNNDYEAGSAAMDNILAFLKKAYGKSNEIELFINSVLTDSEIVLMAISTQNKSFGKYIENITENEKNIDMQINRRKRREVK
ncbi:MAG: AAA family ATPase [Oscillospiraceae bacterium]|nr:AAA family ATPase [Oscillospiraceae bacterium]